MVEPENTYTIGIAQGGLQNSGGHDRLASLIQSTLETGPDLRTQLFSIKPPQGEGTWLEIELWRRIEQEKARLALQARQAFLSTAGKVISENGLVGKLRQSDTFNRLLTHTFTQTMSDSHPDILISSHYMAVASAGDVTSIYYTPDIYLHDAVKALVVPKAQGLIASCQDTREDLLRMGTRPDQILATGVILPPEVYNHVKERIDIQREAITPEKHRVLITLSGSNSELAEVKALIPILLKNNVNFTLLCGSGNPRDNIELGQYAEEQKQKISSEGQVEIIGGSQGFTREQELSELTRLLSDKSYTDLITRPNEMLQVGLAAGFTVYLLRPFQQHEIIAREIARGKPHGNVYDASPQLISNNRLNTFILGKATADNYSDPNFWMKPLDPALLREKVSELARNSRRGNEV